jgi:tetratricopeptide (TPR) repeat protein
MAFALGDNAAAGRHWQETIDLARVSGDDVVRAHALPGVGVVALAVGDLQNAEAAFIEALPLAAEVGVEAEWARALTCIWLGTVHLLRGDNAAASAEIQRGLHSARRRGDRLTSYIALYNLSQVALAEGDYPKARSHLCEGIKLSRETRDAANLAYFFDALSVVEGAEDRFQRAAILLGAAQTMREAAGADVYSYYRPDEARKEHQADRARLVLGADTFDDALDAGRVLQLDNAVDLLSARQHAQPDEFGQASAALPGLRSGRFAGAAQAAQATAT